MKNQKYRMLLALGIIILSIASLYYVGEVWKNDRVNPSVVKPTQGSTTIEIPELVDASSINNMNESYDVIVVGTDPEGVMAAISASRNGLRTLLIDSKNRDRLGGLFTLGWLNSLDMNRTADGQDYYNHGLFKEWYDRIEGDSFDITTAAVAFHEMVNDEPNLDVRLNLSDIIPILEIRDGIQTVSGIDVITSAGEKKAISAYTVIDATQDGDFAAAAGASFTFGREDIGDDELLMAVTPVFKLTNVTSQVWRSIMTYLNTDDSKGTGANEQSAWGFSGMWDYPSTNPDRIRSRGLNLGRQNDQTMLVNAIQIFGIDPFDPASIDEAYELARKELPLMLDYMKELYPVLEPVQLGELAPELYIRETRHIVGEYRLGMDDLLEQTRHWDDIAFGSYPVDIQSTSSASWDRGTVLMKPKQYGVPFRTLVPDEMDGLLVVGRSASFDSLPHGSARVVPLGMATGQAAGAAVKVAISAGLSIHELSASKEYIGELQQLLMEQGMTLNPPLPVPYPFIAHPEYEGLKFAVNIGIAKGAYNNDFQLEVPTKVELFLLDLNIVAKQHKAIMSHPVDQESIEITGEGDTPLSLEQAALAIQISLFGEGEQTTALQQLLDQGVLSAETLSYIDDQTQLTYGDTYMLLKDLISQQ